jgi:hypothetical protein
MEHGKIVVDIRETYRGSEWYEVRIKLPGYGGGLAAEFKLVRYKDILAADGAIKTPLFRPEYAMAIKNGLESA